MFGTYRTFLALAVVINHLVHVPLVGAYAVHGFFILSGYLMTYIMLNSYGYSIKGLRSFALNRFLRLYPGYWFILILTAIAIFWFGEENAAKYRTFIRFPDSPISLFQNLSLIYFDLFPGDVSPRMAPPTWALTIELFFYLLIALGLSRSRLLAVLWFSASVFYMAYTHIFDLDSGYRFRIILSGTLPFSIGAMIFHYHNHSVFSFIKKLPPLTVLVLIALFVINAELAAIAKKYGSSDVLISISFYANYIINSLIIIKLIDGRVPFVSSSTDAKIGNYSYPIYLVHLQAGFVASMLIWGSPVKGFNFEGVTSLILALTLCFFVSFFVIKYIDIPIERYRKKIKENANKLKSDTKSSEYVQVG